MNKKEASQVGLRYLEQFRDMPYAALIPLMSRQPETVEVRGPSGTLYQIELDVFWDDRPNEVIRVQAAIDDGGLRAFVPLVEEFLRAPDGSFMGE